MERLQALMFKNNITGYQLAKDLGINNATLRNWLKGRAACPRGDNLIKLSNYFHVSPQWLQFGDSQSAPTIDSQTQMLAEEIAAYGPEAIQKARQILKIFFERPEIEKRYPVQKRKPAKRKSIKAG